jgi:signal transduction histidine kinase
MQMKHIGTKLFLGFISMTILTVSVIWIIQAGFMNNVYLDQRIDSVQDELSRAAEEGDTDYDAIAESLNVSLIVIDEDSEVVYRSQGLPMMRKMLDSAASMMNSHMDGTPQYISTMSGDRRYAILGMDAQDGCCLFAVFSLADLDAASQLLYQQLWIVTVVMVLLSVFLAVFLSRLLSRPIRAVTQAAHDIASGKSDVKLPVKSKDEIGQLTEALNHLSVELGQTESLRQELIANVSHELRAPLAVIKGYAETIRDVSWPNEDKRTEQLNIISGEASRLTRVVKDILDYSRLQAGVETIQMTSFPICPVLEDLKRQFDLEAGIHQVAIRLECPELTAFFDRDRFIQVIHNLLSNAINHAEADSDVLIRALENQGVCKIEVENIGETIPADMLSRIWERYFRSDQVSTGKALGTGLGLAIVKSIFEQHGVRYGVNSVEGKTMFWFETVASAK